MEIEGGCYCGELRYKFSGEPMTQFECYCRECQCIAGGAPNLAMAIPAEGFSYTKGEPAQFTRDDLETPVTRDFCGKCGTHILGRPPGFPGYGLKVGTMDDPSVFTPQVAAFTGEAHEYHHFGEGVPKFEARPG